MKYFICYWLLCLSVYSFISVYFAFVLPGDEIWQVARHVDGAFEGALSKQFTAGVFCFALFQFCSFCFDLIIIITIIILWHQLDVSFEWLTFRNHIDKYSLCSCATSILFCTVLHNIYFICTFDFLRLFFWMSFWLSWLLVVLLLLLHQRVYSHDADRP